MRCRFHQSGHYYLGSGHPFVSRDAVKRDLRLILLAAKSAKIPVIIGSAGGSGSNQGVEQLKNILAEICTEEQLHVQLATIKSEISAEMLIKR